LKSSFIPETIHLSKINLNAQKSRKRGSEEMVIIGSMQQSSENTNFAVGSQFKKSVLQEGSGGGQKKPRKLLFSLNDIQNTNKQLGGKQSLHQKHKTSAFDE
jgi:hypothetical protein